jgi:hypothetical protein
MAEKAVDAGHTGQLTDERAMVIAVDDDHRDGAMRRHVRRDGAKEGEVGPIEPHTMNPSCRPLLKRGLQRGGPRAGRGLALA